MNFDALSIRTVLAGCGCVRNFREAETGKGTQAKRRPADEMNGEGRELDAVSVCFNFYVSSRDIKIVSKLRVKLQLILIGFTIPRAAQTLINLRPNDSIIDFVCIYNFHSAKIMILLSRSSLSFSLYSLSF